VTLRFSDANPPRIAAAAGMWSSVARAAQGATHSPPSTSRGGDNLDHRERDYQHINSYNTDTYDRIVLMFPKGAKERIKRRAQERGQSVTAFLASFIPSDLIGTWRRTESK